MYEPALVPTADAADDGERFGPRRGEPVNPPPLRDERGGGWTRASAGTVRTAAQARAAVLRSGVTQVMLSELNDEFAQE